MTLGVFQDHLNHAPVSENAMGQEALKGGHLKMGFRSEVRTRKWDFALQFALDTSILTALSKEIPQGRRRLDREGAV